MRLNSKNYLSASKSSDYALIKRRIFFFNTAITGIFLVIFQISGLSKHIYNIILTYYPNFYIKNILFVFVFLVITSILSIPLSYYSQFHLEHRFGLSTQNLKNWVWDNFKGFLLNLIFSIIAIEAVYTLLKFFPQTWWLWTTFFYFLFSIFLSRITPTYILPLFYKVKKVTDESLIQKLKALAEKARVKVLGVYQMNMSRKTKKANAMFTGIGRSKRIILGDTLLNQYAPDEIETILAHELGHCYYRHLWRLMSAGLVMSLTGFYCVHKILAALLNVLGISQMCDISGLPAFLLILFIFFLLLLPLQNGYSRKLEKQADVFALEETKNPKAFMNAMKKLAEQNLSEMNPPRWVEFFLYDHPCIQKRIQLAEKYLNEA